jgi:hypothetical protein
MIRDEKGNNKKCDQDYNEVACKSIVLIFVYLAVSLKGLS